MIRITALASLARSGLFLYLAVMMVLAMGAESGISGWLCIHLQRSCGLSSARAGAALSAFWFGMMVGRLLMGGLTRRIALPVLLLMCGSGGFVFWSLAVIAKGSWLAIALVAAAGAFHAPIFPLILAYANPHFERIFGAASGAMIATGTLGGMTTPYLVGVAADRISLTSAVLMIGLTELGVALLSLGLCLCPPRDAAMGNGNG